MPAIRAERFFVGYAWAVIAATISYLALSILFHLLLALFAGEPGISSSNAPSTLTWGVWIFAVLSIPFTAAFFSLMVGWIIFFVALVPFLIVFAVAEIFRLRSVWFYLVSGGLTGFASIWAYRFFKVGLFPFHSSAPSIELIKPLLLIPLCGAIGGFVYWRKSGHRAGTK